MLEVGQMVVCVDDDWKSPLWVGKTPNRPIKGCIYTIRDLDPGTNGAPSMRLEEIVNPVAPFENGRIVIEPAFRQFHFRPVHKTSIEELRKLVAPVPRQPVPAE